MRFADIIFYFQVEILLLWLALAVLVVWSALWCIHFVGIIYGKWKLHRKVGKDMEAGLPGVSILKPLVGVDPNLFSNLETFFTLKYPTYELLFCVHTDEDPALMFVESLIKKYPSVDAKIFTGGEMVGINPKINNLMPAYRVAKYDLLMISDSGMRMKEDTLLDMVGAMRERVGIVTQMPFICDRKGFPATIEKVFFGTMHARIYLSAHAFGFVCSTGMSSLVRRPLIEECGGLAAFGKYIAEDYFIAQAIHKKGWRSAISSQPGWQNSGFCQLSKFHERVCRWAKLRIAMLPHTILLEPIQDCFMLGLMAGWAVNFLFGWNSLVFFLVHLLIWMLLDYVLLNIVQQGPLPFGKFEFVVCWVYRELSALPVMLRALWNPDIQWRTGTFRLRWGGEARKMSP